jgi:uncharacterized repeat protein (TIGR01451 family)
MAYKYEIEEKAKQLRLRVLIAIYVLFVISAAIIGVSVRLQQIRNISPTRPGASGAGQAGYTLASDPTYNPRNLQAFAYCAEVDGNGNETGTYIPIPQTRFYFKQVGRRDIGQIRSNQTLAQLCSNVPAGCTLRGQTAAQCSSGLTSCAPSDGIPGIICPGGDDIRISGANGLVTWPDSATTLGDLRWDDTEVEVTIDPNYGTLDQGFISYNGNNYIIDKSPAYMQSAAFTPDLNSLLPYYAWQCQNQCTGANCSVAGNSYSSGACTFSGGQFNCPQYKYLNYVNAPPAEDASDDSFLYLRNAARRNANNPTRIHVGFGYDGIVDSSYPQITSTDANSLVAFKGNLVKYRFTCMAQSVVTETPTPPVTTPPETPPITTVPPTVAGYSIDASKTGPVCVERMAPRNSATFTITVRNNGSVNTVINSVDDALPQGFEYTAGTTVINGTAVGDSYVVTTVVGTSQKVTFAPPNPPGPWTLTPNETLTIRFTATATLNAVTGTNVNQVVVNPEGQDAIDNISYQFEVEQTCVPVTGVWDFVLIAAGGMFILFGFYLMYNPRAMRAMERAYLSLENTRKNIDKTARKLERKANVRSRFEDEFKAKIKKSRKKD